MLKQKKQKRRILTFYILQAFQFSIFARNFMEEVVIDAFVLTIAGAVIFAVVECVLCAN